jgi:hypothetical protein
MIIRRAIVVLVAAGLGVWVAVAAAAGGFGAGSTNGSTNCLEPGGTTPRCPKHPEGFGDGGGTGAGGSKHHHHASHGSSGQGGEPHPRPRPEPGTEGHGKLPNFTFSVRLLPGGGASSASVTGYSTHVLAPSGAPVSCTPQLARRANIASRNQVARIHLRAPAGGWCSGHYRVTVTLTR